MIALVMLGVVVIALCGIGAAHARRHPDAWKQGGDAGIGWIDSGSGGHDGGSCHGGDAGGCDGGGH